MPEVVEVEPPYKLEVQLFYPSIKFNSNIKHNPRAMSAMVVALSSPLDRSRTLEKTDSGHIGKLFLLKVLSKSPTNSRARDTNNPLP